MTLIRDLHGAIVNDGMTITQIMRAQHAYHESRSWSVKELFDGRKPDKATENDRAALWHVARAEITTQPACLRMARLGAQVAEQFSDDKVIRTIAESAIQWSARYWLQEEAHHEIAYGMLLEMVGEPAISEQEVYDHRGNFPDDNFARTCVIQACVEIEASILYSEHAKNTEDPLIRDVFLQITRDELQHRQYFISFAKALVDAGAFCKKDIMSMAYSWIKPEGETQGSARKKQTKREGYVNWWETLKTEDSDELSLKKEQNHSAYLQNKKVKSVLSLVKECTGIEVFSVEDLRKKYFSELSRSA